MGRKLILVDSMFRPKKCSTGHQHGNDRISQLPDEILVDILSLLSLNEAARTSVLSSRWVHLWKHTSRLNFDTWEGLEDKIWKEKIPLDVERQKYVNWVNSAIHAHQSPILKELTIRFRFDKSSQQAIDKWLECAFARQVEKLELDLVEIIEDTLYTFPDWFPRQITPNPKPSVKKSFVDHPQFIFFKSLKELSLKHVNITSEVIESLLHSCPLLENLVIHDSEKLVDLEVCGPSLALKYLELLYCTALNSVKVSNTNIVSLTVYGLKVLYLENVPMLVEISVFYLPVYLRFFERVFDWLSCYISQLEILTLTICRCEETMEQYAFPELPKLKKLVIRLWILNDGSLSDPISLITVSPFLQEFVLELTWGSEKRYPNEISEIFQPARFHAPCLKVVKFSGYCGRTNHIQLITYILENAGALEKLIVDPRRTRFPNSAEPRPNCSELQLFEVARNHAKQNLEGRVPPHIDLTIL